MNWLISNTTEYDARLENISGNICINDNLVIRGEEKEVYITLSNIPFDCFIFPNELIGFSINLSEVGKDDSDWTIEDGVSILKFDEMTVTINTNDGQIEVF